MFAALLTRAVAALWPNAPTLAIPDSPDTNPLAGKALNYEIGIDGPFTGQDGRVTEVSYDCTKPAKHGLSIAYCNLFNEKYADQDAATRAYYGPYLTTSDTAEEYDEGQIDPAGAGWKLNLINQFDRRKRQGFQYIELDNPDAYSVSDIVAAINCASTYGFKVIAKNPMIMNGDPLPYVQHPAVVGVIVERGGGSPDSMDVLRKRAGKPDLPVWFVAFRKGRQDGRAWANNIANAIRSGGYRNMSVTYSATGEYTTVTDILLPT